MRTFLFSLILATGFLVATPAFAAEANFFGPIVPTECHSCPCGSAAVMEVIRHLINIAISLGVVFLTVMLAWGGIIYMTSPTNPENRSKANKTLMGAVVGMVIILSAWLVIDFVMRTLYSGPDGTAGKFGPWNSIVKLGTDFCIVPDPNAGKPFFGNLNLVVTPPAPNPDNPTPDNPNPPTPNPVSGNEASVRQQFAAAGVSINNAPCATGSSGTGCTNVGGLRTAAVSQVINLSNLCGKCGVVVTGGSEPGHAAGTYSHGNGYKVDLRNTNATLNALLNKLTRTGQRGGDSGGPIFKDKCGNQYVNESTHWDITVFGPCSPLF